MMKPSKRRGLLPIATQGNGVHCPAPLAESARGIDLAMQPILAVWELTLACDLACRHCGSRAGRARGDELNTQECFDLVDQLAELGIGEVALIGGEAYLRPDWCDIVARIVDRGMQPLLTTGGRGFTVERATQAAAAGLTTVSVSLDGLATTHDSLRNAAGSFEAAIAAMRNARGAGIPVSANTQINRLSMPELPELLETIIAEGAHSWQIQITVAMGRAVDNSDILLQPYELLELYPMLGRLADRCRDVDVLLWPGNNIGYFGPFETAFRGTTPQGHMAQCGAGRGGIGIESDGTIKGCPSLATAKWSGGNIREHSLADIFHRSNELRYMRDRTGDDLWGFCSTCYYADECRGGCSWTAESLLGRVGNNPMCHHRALEHERMGMRERLVQVERAPGRPFDQGRFKLVVEPVSS